MMVPVIIFSDTILFESDDSFDERHVAVQQKDTRLMKDFIIQKYLGRGAFGDVVQARSVFCFSVLRTTVFTKAVGFNL